MPLKELGIGGRPEVLDEPGRTLDVGEQEGDRAGREWALAHGPSRIRVLVTSRVPAASRPGSARAGSRRSSHAIPASLGTGPPLVSASTHFNDEPGNREGEDLGKRRSICRLPALSTRSQQDATAIRVVAADRRASAAASAVLRSLSGPRGRSRRSGSRSRRISVRFGSSRTQTSTEEEGLPGRVGSSKMPSVLASRKSQDKLLAFEVTCVGRSHCLEISREGDRDRASQRDAEADPRDQRCAVASPRSMSPIRVRFSPTFAASCAWLQRIRRRASRTVRPRLRPGFEASIPVQVELRPAAPPHRSPPPAALGGCLPA